jgi:hypothetical protein
MLGDFEHQVVGLVADRRVVGVQRLVDAGELAGWELHVHDRAHHLGDSSFRHVAPLTSFPGKKRTAKAPKKTKK